MIEICIALFVALALFTLAAGIVRMGVREEELPRLRDDLGLLIRQTRVLAMQSGKPRELQLDVGRLLLVHDPEDPPSFDPEVAIPPGVKLEIQVWPEDRWRIPDKVVAWSVPPTGVSLPVSLRLTRGNSWISFRIHPLTGAIDQESRMLEAE